MLNSFRSACSAEAEVCTGQLNFIYKENSLEINHEKSKFCNNFLKDRTGEHKNKIFVTVRLLCFTFAQNEKRMLWKF